jgi:hypothetical protein
MLNELAMRFGFVPILLLAFVPAGWAESGPCPGPKVQPHPPNFGTNSRLVPMNPADTGSFRFGVISCVQNNDQHNPLYARWLIPGPDGWAQQGSYLESGPRLRKDDQVQQLDGCLQYGNRGDMTTALFLSINGDQAKVDDERAHGCRQAVAAIGDLKTGTIEQIKTFIKNFFPSDQKYPAKTMLRFEGTVGIRPKGPDAYESFVEYSVAKVSPDSDASVEGMFIEPEFRGPVESLLRDFRFYNKESNLMIREKGTFSFQVGGIQNPNLAYGTYAIHDRQGQRVGAIDVPLFVSGK